MVAIRGLLGTGGLVGIDGVILMGVARGRAGVMDGVVDACCGLGGHSGTADDDSLCSTGEAEDETRERDGDRAD